MTTSNIRALLVDLDNTLHDYAAAARIARQRLAERIASIAGVPLAIALKTYETIGAEQEVIASSGNEARRRRLVRVQNTLRIPLPIDDLVSILNGALIDAVTPYPGAVNTLKDLTARYRVVIMTEGYADIQMPVARKLGLTDERWDLFVTYSRGCRKHDGSAYAAVLRDCALSAMETAMIGDNWDWDIMAAADKGVAQIWISHDRPMPAPPPARFLGAVPDFCSIIPLLEKASR